MWRTTLLACLVVGCGSSTARTLTDVVAGDDASDAAEPVPSDDAAGAGGGDASGPVFTATEGGVTGAGGTETACDGIDNDHDGIVDNVDVNHDGVCDCLAIATLGAAASAGQSNVFQAWLSARTQKGAVDLGSMTLTPALLAPYQVIVAQNLSAIGRSYAQTEVDALDAWVRAGGGLMTLTGYSGASEVTNANLVLATFGLSYGTQDIMSGTGLPFLQRMSKPVTEWLSHPISKGVTAVGMDVGKPVLGSATKVATGEGYVVAMAATAGAGRIFVWGDEWITIDSEWSSRSDYQMARFWANTLLWLSPPLQCQVAIPPEVK